MNSHHHVSHATMTSLIVSATLIMLMGGFALSAGQRLTGQVKAGSAVSSTAIMQSCAGLSSQSISANESDSRLQAQAAQDQHCASQAESAAAH